MHRSYVPPRARNARGVLRALHGYRHRARERAALGLARLVICNSAATRRAVVEELGVPAERAFVVYLGVDRDLFVSGDAASAAEQRSELGFPPRLAVAFVGALGDRRKGFDTVFEAWRVLCRSPDWDADLVAVGGGSELEAWRRRAADVGLAERVRLLGFRSDVARILGACDALVAPTRYEAFGVAVIEALAMGLPAIVSEAAGVAELFPAALRHLLLSDPESVDELVRKLRAWRQASDLERSNVRALSERVRARSWDDMSAEMLGLMANLAPD